MTEQQEKVINGLECCTQEDMCAFCPYLGKNACERLLKMDALFIIRKQEKQTEELTVRNNELCDTVACLEVDKEGIKANTVRKFADRLKTYYNTLGGATSGILTAYHIEQIANEMLGGDSNDKD